MNGYLYYMIVLVLTLYIVRNLVSEIYYSYSETSDSELSSEL